MTENWVDVVAERLADGPPSRGRFLFLGAADTGKTTRMIALAGRMARGIAFVGEVTPIGDVRIDIPLTWN